MSSENCTASSSGTMLYWDEPQDISGCQPVRFSGGSDPDSFRPRSEWGARGYGCRIRSMARQGKDAEAEAEKERQRLANYSWKGGK